LIFPPQNLFLFDQQLLPIPEYPSLPAISTFKSEGGQATEKGFRRPRVREVKENQNDNSKTEISHFDFRFGPAMMGFGF
jgi:hypothetical protein